MSKKTVSRGARMAIVAGIITAIVIVATVAAMSVPNEPQLPADDGNGNNTAGEGKNIVVENENLDVEAK